ncbi:hypothetical protein [Spirulina major]|nr:hypothetical protein [Spirulina major]
MPNAGIFFMGAIARSEIFRWSDRTFPNACLLIEGDRAPHLVRSKL